MLKRPKRPKRLKDLGELTPDPSLITDVKFGFRFYTKRGEV